MAELKKITIDGDVFNGRVELTQAEYDALPASEKNNGIMYLITDAGGGTAGGSGSVAWGNITGTLSNQVDLATALEGFVPLTGSTDMSGEFDIAGTSMFVGYETSIRGDGITIRTPYSQDEFDNAILTPSVLTLTHDDNGVSPSVHERIHLTTAGLSKERNGDNSVFAVTGLTPITGATMTSSTATKTDNAVSVADIRDGIVPTAYYIGNIVNFHNMPHDEFTFTLTPGRWVVTLSATLYLGGSSAVGMITVYNGTASVCDIKQNAVGYGNHTSVGVVDINAPTQLKVTSLSDTASSHFERLAVVVQRAIAGTTEGDL